MTKAAQLTGLHVHFNIPQGDEKPPIVGAGVVVHHQPKDEGLPGPLARKYYNLASDGSELAELEKRIMPSEHDRIVVLDVTGRHWVISSKSWEHLHLG